MAKIAKSVLTLIFIQATCNCFGQLDEKIADEACKCFESAYSKRIVDMDRFMDDFMSTCVKELFYKYQDEFLNASDINDSTTTNAEAYGLGRKFGVRVMSSMIMCCNRFYHLMDSIRWSGLDNIDRSKAEVDLVANSRKIKNGQETSATYFSRGMAYLQLKKFKKANKDFEKAIELDSTFGPGYLFLGTIKEIQGDYKGAINEYQKSMSLLRKDEILAFISLAERKEQERNGR